jgi:hypothetical protein
MTQGDAQLLHTIVESQPLRDAVQSAIFEERTRIVDLIIAASRNGNQTETARLAGEWDAFDRVMRVLESAAAQYRVSRE